VTIRVGHNAQGHRSRDQRRAPMVPEPVKKVKRQGIVRSPRKRVAPKLPLSEHQQQVLDAIEAVDPGDDRPFSAAKLAEAIGGSKAGTTSTLYVLQDRGLVERIPYKGWRRL
jgi:DNA-binding MarR family transcriptional regulator